MKKKRMRYLIVISWHVETMLHMMILGVFAIDLNI